MTITIDIEEEESDQAPESEFLDINISKGTKWYIQASDVQMKKTTFK